MRRPSQTQQGLGDDHVTSHLRFIGHLTGNYKGAQATGRAVPFVSSRRQSSPGLEASSKIPQFQGSRIAKIGLFYGTEIGSRFKIDLKYSYPLSAISIGDTDILAHSLPGAFISFGKYPNPSIIR